MRGAIALQDERINRISRIAHYAQRGFTLIEVLIAMAILTVLALLSWRGIEAMLQVQAVSKQRTTEMASLQTALAQWISDLDHVQVSGISREIFYDGKVFLTTREDLSDPQRRLRTIAWAAKPQSNGSTWLMRWQSEPFATRQGLVESANEARKWYALAVDSAEESKYDVVKIVPVNKVEIKAYDANAGRWVSMEGANLLMPGIRIEVELADAWSVSGTVVRDWVHPTYVRRRNITNSASSGTGGSSGANSGQVSGTAGSARRP